MIAKNPMYLLGDEQVKRLGAERAARWAPCRTLLAAGIPVVLATDGAPGLPFNNPFLGIQIATTDPMNPQEAITREQALIAYTRTAAYSEFAEDQLGTLEAGKLADLGRAIAGHLQGCEG